MPTTSPILQTSKKHCKLDVLWNPTAIDIDRLLDESLKAGFPGCLGSIDCMHWIWKNCPTEWKGAFQGKCGRPTVVLEAICDARCRFWHFNFGSPGALNDINILDRSPLFDKANRGEASKVNFVVNNNAYNYGYWLADGIYPSYACFVETIPNPRTRMQKLFASAQEAKRKDIERAFGILQARFHILTTGCRPWDRNAMKTVMKTCVVLHNLIIDHERTHNLDSDYINDAEYVSQDPFAISRRRNTQSFDERRHMIASMKSLDEHEQLRHDLMVEKFEKWQLENGSDSHEDVGMAED